MTASTQESALAWGHDMKLTIRPLRSPRIELDVTNLLVAAIADELWSLHGGDETLNRLEAEIQLWLIIERVRTEAREADAAAMTSSSAAAAGRETVGACPRQAAHEDELLLSRTIHDGARPVGTASPPARHRARDRAARDAVMLEERRR